MKEKQMKNLVPKTLPNLSDDARLFLQNRKKLKSYELQEEILQKFTHKHPNHDVYEEVEIKAKLLNLFYSTGIQAIDSMVKNIMSIKDIDKILIKPKYSKDLINAIAELNLKDNKKRNNYSFATKYCALHQPKKYPIYDSIVAAILTKLMKTEKLPPYRLKRNKSDISSDTYMTQGEFETKLRDYDFFVKVYDTFMEDYGLKQSKFTYRKVDWYLWGSYKDGSYKSLIEELAPLREGKDYTIVKPKNIAII